MTDPADHQPKRIPLPLPTCSTPRPDPAQPTCPTCGPTTTIRTQSHDQCARCGRVLASCCDGH